MPTIGASAVSFEHVSREWRCKYTMDAEGGPANSASLKACEALLQEYLPKLKALPAVEVRRVVCGVCTQAVQLLAILPVPTMMVN